MAESNAGQSPPTPEKEEGTGQALATTSEVLRGKQAVVRVYARRPTTDEPEPPVEEVSFKLTNNDVAALEEHFGGHEGLATVLERTPVMGLRSFFAIGVLHCEAEEAGDRMLTEDFGRYWAAVEAAYTIALGGTEDAAKKAAGQRLVQLELGALTQTEMWDRVMEGAKEIRGEIASRRGSSSRGRSKSSGGSRQRKRTS